MQADLPVTAHLGIRFATAGRYAPSVPAEGSAGAVRLTEVPVFPQLPGRLDAAMGRALARNPQHEDAFFCNVWAPAGADRVPVLVFLHGGAWTTGGGSAAWYDGTRLAATGLVVVTVNYRIGPLAHLAPEPEFDPTPLAIGDLLLALRWVRANIATLGGDPDRVTLAGQSTGGWYAHLLNLCPAAAGLFDQVALFSAATRRPWSRETLLRHSSSVAQRIGTDLRRAEVGDLLRVGAQVLREQPTSFGSPPSAYLPTQSPILPPALSDPPTAARSMHAQAVLLRTTCEETAAFFHDAPERGLGAAQYTELVRQTSWQHFVRFATDLDIACSAAGRWSRHTVFAERSTLPGFGGGHTFDLPFQFGDPGPWADAPMLAGHTGPAFAGPSRQLITELHHFVTRPRSTR